MEVLHYCVYQVPEVRNKSKEGERLLRKEGVKLSSRRGSTSGRGKCRGVAGTTWVVVHLKTSSRGWVFLPQFFSCFRGDAEWAKSQD